MSSPIRCPGSECGYQLRVQPEHAGKSAQCPLCKTVFTVPDLVSVSCTGCGKEITGMPDDVPISPWTCESCEANPPPLPTADRAPVHFDDDSEDYSRPYAPPPVTQNPEGESTGVGGWLGIVAVIIVIKVISHGCRERDRRRHMRIDPPVMQPPRVDLAFKMPPEALPIELPNIDDGKLGTMLAFANKGEVYFKGEVPQELAQRLGEFLVQKNFFDGQKKRAQLLTNGDGYRVRFGLKTGLFELERNEQLTVMGAEISAHVLDRKEVQVEICTYSMFSFRRIPSRSYVQFQKGLVIYDPTTSKDQAQHIGEFMSNEGFFKEPTSVKIGRMFDKVEIRYYVDSKQFDDPPTQKLKKLCADLDKNALNSEMHTIIYCDASTLRTRRFTSAREPKKIGVD